MPSAPNDIPNMKRRTLENQSPPASWNFNDVASGFEHHVKNSIPFYEEIHDLTLNLAEHFLGVSSVADGNRPTVADLGCSTGNLLEKFAMRFSHLDLELIGIDSSREMVAQAEQQLKETGAQLIAEPLESADLPKAGVFTALFTLQFLSLSARKIVIDRIFEALPKGGCLILFEKTYMSTGRIQELANDIYMDWKKDRGFSENQIRNKTRSLRGVMRPMTTQSAIAELETCGFSEVYLVFQWLQFHGILALK